VFENMAFGLRIRRRSDDEIRTRVGEAAQILKIEHLLDRRPRELSGGQRQRVAMGRAIVRQPKAFLFDEPLSNLDALLRAEMRIEIKKLHQRLGNTVIYVTHDQIEAMTLADRIVVLRNGHILQVGTPDDIYNRPAARFVAGFTGSPPMNFLACTVAADGAALELAGGLRLPIPTARRELCRANAGRSLTFGLRPEHIVAGNGHGPDWVAVPANVQLVEPLGSDTLGLLRLGDGEITGRFPPEAGLAAGKPITVSLPTNRFHLFDSQTEAAIRGPGW
jgi:ABC-type sugar transport system ATPase subunit